MRLGLHRSRAVLGGVPAPAQLLEARHVDAAVVEVVVERGEVAREETPVDPDAVAAQWRRARFRDAGANVVEDLCSGGREVDRRRLDLREQTRLGVHPTDEVVHLVELGHAGVRDEVDAVVEDLELGIGDEARDLDDRVSLDVEPRHLEVDPDEPGVGGGHGRRRYRRPGFESLASRTVVTRADLVELVGRRVLLRPLRVDDWDVWRELRIRCREWLEPWEPVAEPGSPDPVRDRDAFRSRCGAWDRQRHFDAAYGFGMFRRDDGRLVGEVSLGSVQRGPFQSAYVGYWVDEALAGQEYVPEGVAVILRYGFETLGLHRMEAAIVPRNVASRRVVEKLGMREEGISLRFLQIQGVYEDHARYAMTREEWDDRLSELTAAWLG